MIDLEERLNRASHAVRSQVDRVPIRPACVATRRVRRRTTAMFATGLLTATVLFAAGVLVLTGGFSTVASQPGDQAPMTYTLSAPEWELIAVGLAEDGSGISHTLFDRARSEAVPRRFQIDTGSIAVDRRNTLIRAGVEPVATGSLMGSPVSVYSLEDKGVTVAFASVVALWTSPDGEDFAFLFESVTLDEVQGVISGLEPVGPEEWQMMLADYEPPVTTTILGKNNT